MSSVVAFVAGIALLLCGDPQPRKWPPPPAMVLPRPDRLELPDAVKGRS